MPISANLAGVGLRIAHDYERKGFRVTEIWPRGPAAMSTVIALDDLLIGVGPTALHNKSTKEVGELLKGAAGSQVKLTLMKSKGNTKFSVVLTRQQRNEPFEVIL